MSLRDHRNVAGRSRLQAERTSYRSCLIQLHHAQKTGAGVPAYTRWINRRLARYAAAGAVAVGMTPNMVTAASGVLSLCGLALLLAPPSIATGLGCAALLVGGYVLDSADGQVARVTGRGGPSGEWLDHVVDAVRTPAIHLAALASLGLHTEVPRPALALPILYCLMSTGHFMSQILAEQLARGAGPGTSPGDVEPGPLRSFLLLPTDGGILCWIFILWGSPPLFLAGYGCLFLLNLVAVAASLRRKYRNLVSLRQDPRT